MTEFFNPLAQSGFTVLKLRVKPDNQAALNLYRKVGFDITGINMAKKLAGGV